MCYTLEEEIKYVQHNEDRYIYAIRILDNLLSKLPKRIRILDIGTSPFTFLLKNRYPQAEIHSIDITSHFKNMCEKAGIKFYTVDLNSKKASLGSHKYEIVTFLEVIEHLKGNHELALKKITNSLKKGGYFIIQTPNKNSLKSMFVGIVSSGLWDMVTKRPKLPEEFVHFKEYSLGELKNLVLKISSLRLLWAKYAMYFDTTKSALVYRKHVNFFRPLMILHHRIAKYIPSVRRGICLLLVKL